MNYLEKAEKALEYLAESEQEYARLKAQHQALKERLKIVKAEKFLDSSASTVKERDASAEESDAYVNAVTDWENCLADFYIIESRRERARLTIDFWRSYQRAQIEGTIC